MSNFIEDCIAGDAMEEDIHDYIDRWHDSEDDQSLIEFLGMTKIEYSLFVESDEYLPFIIRAHREREPIEQMMKNFSMVARSENVAKSNQISSWLKKEGLID